MTQQTFYSVYVGHFLVFFFQTILLMVQKSQTTTWDGAKTRFLFLGWTDQAQVVSLPDFWTINSITLPFKEDLKMDVITLRSSNIAGWKIHHEWRCISYWKWVFSSHSYVCLAGG